MFELIELMIQDAGLLEDCKKAVKTTIDELGGLDIIISNAVRISTATISFASELADHCCQGWTKVTNFGDLHAMNDDEWDKVRKRLKTFDVVAFDVVALF